MLPHLGTRDPAAAWLRVRNLSKTFPGTRALAGVSLDVARGEIHSLLGGNGSGKSTFIKVLAGVHQGDPGGLLDVGGASVAADRVTPEWAARAGLGFVHQDLGLFDPLSVAENVFAGRPYPRRHGRIDWAALHHEAAVVLERLQLTVSPSLPVGRLRASDRTLVAVARAVRGREDFHAGALVLDEPTARLEEPEVERLLAALRRYAGAGQAILYVSHRLEEVLALADRVTVLRDGRRVETRAAARLDPAALTRLIVGRVVAEVTEVERGEPSAPTAPRAAGPPGPAGPPRAPVLDVRGLRGGPVEGVDLTVAAGEVVGLAGMVGSGRSTLLKLIYGALPRAGGEVVVAGAPLGGGGPVAAIRAGVGMVPEDRAAEGAFLDLSVAENITAGDFARRRPGGLVPRRRERAEARRAIGAFGVRARSATSRMALLSGGNQQKVVLARWLRGRPRLLLLDEPTQGVDVGARAEIYLRIRAAADDGCGVLVASSDVDELLRLCDRVLVLHAGRVVAAGDGPGVDREWLADHVFGHGAPQEEQR